MTTLPVTLFDKHIILQFEEQVILIDTGAPSTIHRSNKLTFLGIDYVVTSNYMGLTIQSISDLLGMEITTLMGADILSKYCVQIDYNNCQIAFSNDSIAMEGEEIIMETFMGIPVLQIKVGESCSKMFLDTGAKLSYLNQAQTVGLEHVGQEQDFYPGLGNFNTDCYQTVAHVGKSSFNVKFGVLPTLLQTTLMMAGTQGILGSDFFTAFNVCIDYTNHKVIVKHP